MIHPHASRDLQPREASDIAEKSAMGQLEARDGVRKPDKAIADHLDAPR